MAGRLLGLLELVLLLARPLARLACRAAKRLPPGATLLQLLHLGATVLQLLHLGATLAPGGNSLTTGEVVSQLSYLGNLAALAPGGNSLTTGGSCLAALAPGGNRLAALAPRGSCDGAGRATCQILPQYCHILPTLRLAEFGRIWPSAVTAAPGCKSCKTVAPRCESCETTSPSCKRVAPRCKSCKVAQVRQLQDDFPQL